jgi:hypothetical protein
MGAQGANQHLAVFVSDYVALSTKVGVDPNALLPGETAFVSATTGLTVADGTADFRIVHVNTAGAVYMSGVIPGGTDVTDKGSVPAVQKISTLQVLPATPAPGDQYVVKLNVPGYGGLLGSQDDVNFYGNYTVAAGGNTPTEVATALAASLQTAINKQSVAMVVITSSTDKVVATGIAQPYDQARWSGRFADFHLEMAQPTAAWNGAVVTPGTAGFGTGNRVAEQEEFYAGYNTAYKNRFADWPAMVNPVLDALPAAEYIAKSIILDGAHNTGTPNVTTQRQTVILYFKVGGTAIPTV